MPAWEQYEVWAEKGGKWGKVVSSRDFDLASTVARNYRYKVRVILAGYEDGKPVRQDILAEVGSTRREP